MKVYAFTRDTLGGGASRATLRILNALQRKAGVRLFCESRGEKYPWVYRPENKYISRSLMATLVRPFELLHSIVYKLWITFCIRRGSRRVFFPGWGIISLRKTIKERQDVVTSLFWIQDFLSPADVARREEPLVITLHDMWLLTGGCGYAMDCEQWRNGCLHCPDATWIGRLLIRRQRAINQRLLGRRRKIRFIATSEWMSMNLRECDISPELISVIKNFIPRKFCYLGENKELNHILGIPDSDKKTILFIGSTRDWRKGFDLLRGALLMLGKEIINDLRLVVLGDDSPSESLKRVSLEQHFLGLFKDDESLALLYNIADLLVVPSRFDNTPNVVAEAHMCGLPVLALPETGTSEMIQNGINGLVTKTPTLAGIAQSITDYIISRHQFSRQQISKSAREIYGEAATVDRYMEIYEQLILSKER